MDRSQQMFGSQESVWRPVKVSDRRGHVRGRQAQLLVDGIDGAVMATEDPIERRALEDLRDRAASLARRGAGIRGLW